MSKSPAAPWRATWKDGGYLAAQEPCGRHGYQATAGWRFGNKIDDIVETDDLFSHRRDNVLKVDIKPA